MTESVAPGNRRTLIGVLASQDSRNKNEELAQALLSFYKHLKHRKSNCRFHFLFTGGTFERVVLVHDPKLKKTAHAERVRELLQAKWEWPEGAVTHDNWDPYKPDSPLQQTKAVVGDAASGLGRKAQRDGFFTFLREHSTVLPSFREGGVTLLANLVVRRACSILWILLSPNDMHWLNPDNLALMRLCDHFRGKRLMNFGSIRAWIEHEANDDALRNPRGVFNERIEGADLAPAGGKNGGGKERCVLRREELYDVGPYRALRLEAAPGNCKDSGVAEGTVALIAHNEMKDQMANFALDFEDQLSGFQRILATGTTGKLVQETAPSLSGKVLPLHSGPKGGDVEIAVEILAGRCQYVVFFVDPLRPHPHIDDVRVVFGACMRAPNVQIFTNEAHAREWMERRRREQ